MARIWIDCRWEIALVSSGKTMELCIFGWMELTKDQEPQMSRKECTEWLVGDFHSHFYNILTFKNESHSKICTARQHKRVLLTHPSAVVPTLAIRLFPTQRYTAANQNYGFTHRATAEMLAFRMAVSRPADPKPLNSTAQLSSATVLCAVANYSK